MSLTNHEFIALVHLCWTAFALFWAAAAITAKRSAERQSMRDAWPYLLVMIAGFWLLFASQSRIFPGPLRREALGQSPGPSMLGVVVVVLGLLLAIWARVSLGGNWSGAVTFKENHELVTRGPYRLVRHPIYSALLAMSVGTALVYGTWGSAVGVVLIFVSCWIKLRHEERLMLEHFPAAYPEYARTVKRLIPFIL